MESHVSGGEIEFLVVGRVIGDVHFAVLARNAAVGVINDCRVVVQAGGAFLKHRRHEHDAALARYSRILGRLLAWNLDRKVKIVHVLHLAEVERVMQLGQDYELCALGGKVFYLGDERLAVALNVAAVALLYDSYFH